MSPDDPFKDDLVTYIVERFGGDNFPVLPPPPVSRWVRLRGLRWNIRDAWLCLRGTHHAERSL